MADESTTSAGPGEEKTDGVRCFLALELSAEVRSRVADLVDRLKKGIVFTGAHPAWVAVENIHLTLHFLGSVAPERIEVMKSDLDAVAAKFAPPELSVRQLGAFPNEKNPKVLWIGIWKPDRSLLGLYESLMPVIAKQGARPDTRPYHPHLTLARIKSMRGLKGMMDVVGSHKRYEAGTFRPEELILFQSELRPTGAVYTPLHRSRLGGVKSEGA